MYTTDCHTQLLPQLLGCLDALIISLVNMKNETGLTCADEETDQQKPNFFN
jgi:hypothetical protein